MSREPTTPNPDSGHITLSWKEPGVSVHLFVTGRCDNELWEALKPVRIAIETFLAQLQDD